MVVNRDETERTSDLAPRQRGGVDRFLFLVLEAARLEGSGMRLALEGVSELSIGRGTERVATRLEGGKRSLVVPDPRMSTLHARLVHRDGAVRIVDAGSTNGTLRNGVTVTDSVVRDGDLLELGNTSFVYREILDPDGPAGDLDPSSSADVPVGLTTLDPLLARRLSQLTRVGTSPLSAMLLGETGTGKEVLARALHKLSNRPGPFVAVNCGAIPQNLVESHLFGHVKGSFSGAVRDEPGLIRSAQFGTLLLDEIGDLPASSQATLLRVLQEGEVLAIGSVHPTKVDIRIISATHQPLSTLVESGQFRRDLYARLAGYSFEIPPLRDRMVDFGILVASLLASRRVTSKSKLRIHRDAARAMLQYDWPMNVRELEQCLRASSVLSDDGVITLKQLPPIVAEALHADRPEPEEALSEREIELRRELVRKLVEAKGNVSEAARLMGKARQQVQRWLRRFTLDPESFRDGPPPKERP